MTPRVIKSEEQYEEALQLLEELIARQPEPGSADAEHLELLSVLLEHYEKQRYDLGRPTAIDAIRFRMDQQGLTPRDLVPYFGSRAKVSEVLSGKRPLTLSMIRSLHDGLGIPADILLQAAEDEPKCPDVDYTKFPLREMARRGYFGELVKLDAEIKGTVIAAFLRNAQTPQLSSALCRQGKLVRSAKPMDSYALWAWCARVLGRASEIVPKGEFQQHVITDEWLVDVARLSWSDLGPVLAVEFLARHGIILIVEPHLPKTHLDGAAILTPDGTPVIGMTLRHDRIDNFWFTLLHELVHVQKHLRDPQESFVDDLDYQDSVDARETEADVGARDALIPPIARFQQSQALLQKTPEAVRELAAMLHIHPAVVAGRIRHDVRNYRILGQLVGNNQVRSHFPGVLWQD